MSSSARRHPMRPPRRRPIRAAPSACVTSRAADADDQTGREDRRAHDPRHAHRRSRRLHQSRLRRPHQAVLPDGTFNAEARPYAGARFHAAPYDPVENTLDIDFAIHDAAGDALGRAGAAGNAHIGGPRGSFIIPTTYDWHLLIGDETGLPAIGRGSPNCRPVAGRVLAEVDGPARDRLRDRSERDRHWAYRKAPRRRERRAGADAIDAETAGRRLLRLVACKSLTAKALRASSLPTMAPIEMDPRRRLLAPRRGRRARGA